MVALEEVGCLYSVETVDMFQWEHLMPEHLRLSPHGTVPVLVTLQGEPLLGEKLLQSVQEMGDGKAMVKLFPDGELVTLAPVYWPTVEWEVARRILGQHCRHHSRPLPSPPVAAWPGG